MGTYREEQCDLFSKYPEYNLAHCISADFALGAGIAKEFDKRFDMRSKLFVEFSSEQHHDLIRSFLSERNSSAACVLIDDSIYNLITKKYYYNKPTYTSLYNALKMLKSIMISKNHYKLAIPRLGCGLDGLNWKKVSEMIQEIFIDPNYDFDIVVCSL